MWRPPNGHLKWIAGCRCGRTENKFWGEEMSVRAGGIWGRKLGWTWRGVIVLIRVRAVSTGYQHEGAIGLLLK